MASWILVPALVSLRDEFNVLAPDRDKSSDGSIGDQAHSSSSSDHNPDETGKTPSEDSDNINEVHAIDVDADLRKPGWTMGKAIDVILTRHRLGKDNRLKYIIYNRTIWSESWGWKARDYHGLNPHDKHAHFSSKYGTSQEKDMRPWGLLEEEGVGFMSLPKKGDDSQDVAYWQYIYSRAKNMYPGVNFPNLTIDGNYGPATAAAFVSFWKAAGGTGTYDGAILGGWTAMKMQEAFARNAVRGMLPDVTPGVPISDDKLKGMVNDWLAANLPEDLSVKIENVEGRLFLR